jgi:hypothetical protein
MIAVLTRKDGTANLEAAKSSYLADQKAQEDITAIFSQQQIPETQLTEILAAVPCFDPGQDIGSLLAEKTLLHPRGMKQRSGPRPTAAFRDTARLTTELWYSRI